MFLRSKYQYYIIHPQYPVARDTGQGLPGSPSAKCLQDRWVNLVQQMKLRLELTCTIHEDLY
jgi:hypothetical protein